MTTYRSALFSFLATFLVFAPLSVQAEAFAEPTLETIVQALIRYGALDVKEDKVMDLYGGVMVCDLYQEFYPNDFKWNKIRSYLREQIKKEVAFFPTGFRYDTELQLGKYDFKEKMYRFSRETAQFDANIFVLSTNFDDDCRPQDGLKLPNTFKLVLKDPVTIEGLAMDEEAGKILFKHLDERNNPDHLIYTRFNIGITYVAPFLQHKILTGGETNQDFRRGEGAIVTTTSDIRFDGYLDSVEYYEDPEYTRLIYRYIP